MSTIWLIVFILFVASPCSSFIPQLSTLRSKSVLSMAGGQVPMVPYYPNKASKDYQWMDIYNALGRTRTLFVGRFLDEEAANQLIASLIWLQGQSEKDPITMYFNVPGSIIKPSLAVYDVMRRMTCPLITINTGLTVGMGALLCAVGTEGSRFAFPNSRFLMSRVGLEDGFQGQATDIALMVADVMNDNRKMTGELARLCGVPLQKLENDLKRDFYLTAAEAAAYGLIDKVMIPAQPVKMMRYRGEDDDLVNFGHFSEVRLLKSGPTDKIVQYAEQERLDQYAADEMSRRGYDQGRPTQQSIKKQGAAGRFANSRCRPPGIVPKAPPPGGADGPPGDDGGKDKFKNTGW